MKRSFFLFGIFSMLFFSETFAQQQWTLNQCIEYARTNNLNIQQQELNTQMSENNLFQSKMDLLPNLNANGNYSLSSGWSVNPFTNDFTRSDVGSLNMGISSSITLFSGLQKLNTIKQNQKNLESASLAEQKLVNDISMALASAFLEILFTTEMEKVAAKKVEISQADVQKTTLLVDAGSLAKGALLESESQLALDEASLVNSRNQLASSLLNLKQMLDLDTVTNFNIAIPQLVAPQNWNLETVEDIFAKAQRLPEIQKAMIDLAADKLGVKIAQGARYPSLSASFSYGTGYSDAANQVAGISADPFSDQIKNNASTTLGVSLSIPIFNRWMVQRNVNNAKLGVQNSEILVKLANNQLYKEIQQAHANTLAAIANYQSGKKAYEALKESFFYTNEKYKVGMVSIYDFNKAKNTLNQIESDMVRYKYDAIFKSLILDFYSGNKLKIGE